jgi:hypothetical protein
MTSVQTVILGGVGGWVMREQAPSRTAVGEGVTAVGEGVRTVGEGVRTVGEGVRTVGEGVRVEEV